MTYISLYSQKIGLHHQLFMQHLIRICKNINNHKDQLWKLISGANAYDNDNKTFKFIKRHRLINITKPKYTLYNHLMSQIHRWIDYTYRLGELNKETITARSLVNRHTHDSVKYDQDLIFHIRNDTYNEWLDYKHKLRDDDILISTDSSRDTNSGLAGFGVRFYKKL